VGLGFEPRSLSLLALLVSRLFYYTIKYNESAFVFNSYKNYYLAYKLEFLAE
jgi:hypothetical protein